MSRSIASDPGNMTLSHEKLKQLRPDLFGLEGLKKKWEVLIGRQVNQFEYLTNQLQNGDTRAAIVVRTNPLLVAAYTDELDCIALLKFDDFLTQMYGLQVGTRLLTVNFYKSGSKYDTDLILGPKMIPRWSGFNPLIADFVSDESHKIHSRKLQISEEEWQRTYALGVHYMQTKLGIARLGKPFFFCGGGIETLLRMGQFTDNTAKLPCKFRSCYAILLLSLPKVKLVVRTKA